MARVCVRACVCLHVCAYAWAREWYDMDHNTVRHSIWIVNNILCYNHHLCVHAAYVIEVHDMARQGCDASRDLVWCSINHYSYGAAGMNDRLYMDEAVAHYRHIAPSSSSSSCC